jgi:hypothetical protein
VCFKDFFESFCPEQGGKVLTVRSSVDLFLRLLDPWHPVNGQLRNLEGVLFMMLLIFQSAHLWKEVVKQETVYCRRLQLLTVEIELSAAKGVTAALDMKAAYFRLRRPRPSCQHRSSSTCMLGSSVTVDEVLCPDVCFAAKATDSDHACFTHTPWPF